MLALDPDRLLAPFRREAGLEPPKPSYENWESGGLDGHTAGHYLSALADMIASGNDTKEGELHRRLDYMVDELELCQKAFGDGYVGGVPGSRELWKQVAAGHIEALNQKWVPWYNLHKTFAGLRDACLVAGNRKARDVLVRFGDWCERVTAGLSDAQMQRMLGNEHGGMNEVLADIYAITGDQKYLTLARRFCHRAVLDPLEHEEDRLTGLHANTQIPKVIGLERIATLAGDQDADIGARFFWETVVGAPLRRFWWEQRLRALQRSRKFPRHARTPRRPRKLQHLQHAATHRAAFRRRAQGALRRLLRACPVRSPAFGDQPGSPRLRLFHADPAGALPRLFSAGARVLVLCGHGDGESRQVWEVHLCRAPRTRCT